MYGKYTNGKYIGICKTHFVFKLKMSAENITERLLLETTLWWYAISGCEFIFFIQYSREKFKEKISFKRLVVSGCASCALVF